MKGKVLNIIQNQEPYIEQLEVQEPGSAVAELTEEDEGDSVEDNQEQPHLQQEEVKEAQKTEGTPIIEKTKIASVERDSEEEPIEDQYNTREKQPDMQQE